MNEEAIDAIISKLSEVAKTLAAIEKPDMDVVEWSATPIGKAVWYIEETIEMLEELEELERKR